MSVERASYNFERWEEAARVVSLRTGFGVLIQTLCIPPKRREASLGLRLNYSDMRFKRLPRLEPGDACRRT